MKKVKTFEEHIIGAILSQKEFEINKIENLTCLVTKLFSKEQYPEIESFLKCGDIQAIENLLEIKSPIKEYLDVYHFTDHSSTNYYASIYDSDELWQDPQLIALYKQS